MTVAFKFVFCFGFCAWHAVPHELFEDISLDY